MNILYIQIVFGMHKGAIQIFELLEIKDFKSQTQYSGDKSRLSTEKYKFKFCKRYLKMNKC